MSLALDVETVSKGRRHLLSMFGALGFDVSSYVDASPAEIAAMIATKQLDMDLVPSDPSKRAVYVHFHHGKGPRSTLIYEILEDQYLSGKRPKTADTLIISQDPANDTLQRTLHSVWAQHGVLINVVGLSSIQFNIMQHTLVPPHRRLTEEEAQSVREEYGISNSLQLPTISRFGTVPVIIGLRPGEICEITRSSPTSLKSMFYRICSP